MNHHILMTTPFGAVGIIWLRVERDPKIARVLLSRPGLPAEEQVFRLYPDARRSSCGEVDAVAAGIEALLEGEDVQIALDVLDWRACSSFQQSVLRVEHAIPRGRISTYRLIAAHLDKPHGARAVGTALARNPFPLIVPCHRAVRSDRHLGGYQGGLAMKRALLEQEGVLFDDGDRAICDHFHYERREPRKGPGRRAGD